MPPDDDGTTDFNTNLAPENDILSPPPSKYAAVQDSSSGDTMSTINRDDISSESSCCSSSASSSKPSKKMKNRWMWNDEMVASLLDNIITYKNDMTYQGLDFQADLVSCYTQVRKMMAQQYDSINFGPIGIPNENTDYMDGYELVEYKRKVERLEKMKKEGYHRIRVKVKDLRSGYKQAIDKGTRSGSGRLIFENYEKLHEIWGGSPAVSALDVSHCSLPQTPNIGDDLNEEDDDTNNTEVVRDNKRDKMKKNLSAHQRDMMQIDLTRQEYELKKRAVDIMEENIKGNAESIKLLTNSVSEIGQNIKDGLSILANAMIQCQQMSNASILQQQSGYVPGQNLFQSNVNGFISPRQSPK